jgi:hypothetical protein
MAATELEIICIFDVLFTEGSRRYSNAGSGNKDFMRIKRADLDRLNRRRRRRRADAARLNNISPSSLWSNIKKLTG